jgi:hypothetical protein
LQAAQEQLEKKNQELADLNREKGQEAITDDKPLQSPQSARHANRDADRGFRHGIPDFEQPLIAKQHHGSDHSKSCPATSDTVKSAESSGA